MTTSRVVAFRSRKLLRDVSHGPDEPTLRMKIFDDQGRPHLLVTWWQKL
jgi:hypothetical protein